MVITKVREILDGQHARQQQSSTATVKSSKTEELQYLDELKHSLDRENAPIVECKSCKYISIGACIGLSLSLIYQGIVKITGPKDVQIMPADPRLGWVDDRKVKNIKLFRPRTRGALMLLSSPIFAVLAANEYFEWFDIRKTDDELYESLKDLVRKK